MPKTQLNVIALLIVVGCISLFNFYCEPVVLTRSAILEEYGIGDLPERDEYQNDDGVILIDKMNVVIDNDFNRNPYYTFNYHRAILVFNAISRISTVEIPLPPSKKMTYVNARTILPNGTVIPVKTNEIYTVKMENSSLSGSSSTLLFSFPAVEQGAILEYEYGVRKNVELSFEPWNFQKELPVLQAEYSFDLPLVFCAPVEKGGLGWNIDGRIYNSPPIKMESSVFDDKIVTFKMKVRNVPSLGTEPCMPSVQAVRRHVLFSWKWNNWNKIGSGYYTTYFKSQIDTSQKISSIAHRLTDNVSNPFDKIDALYKEVQDLKYVPYDLGDQGIIPAKPLDVYTRKYGDCKDKALLLICLLKTIGIESSPALVFTSNEGVTDSTFPQFSFNHMIVKTTDPLNGKALWLDPTAETYPIGKLSWTCQGVNALVIRDSNNVVMERTVQTTEKENHSTITTTVTLNMDEEYIKYQVAVGCLGESCYYLRAMLKQLSYSEQFRYLCTFIHKDLHKATVTDIRIAGIENEANELRFTYTIIDQLYKYNNNDYFVVHSLPVSIGDVDSLTAMEKRRYPLNLKYKQSIDHQFVFIFKENECVPKNIPYRYNVKQCGVRFNYSSKMSPEMVSINNTLAIDTTTVSAKEYPAFRKVMGEIGNLRERRIICEFNE